MAEKERNDDSTGKFEGKPGHGKRILLRTFGCQMNEYDSELVTAILLSAGFSFVDSEDLADVILLNTCSVRDNAQRKIFGLVHEIRHRAGGRDLLVGILGCLAGHWKEDLVGNPRWRIDFAVGPDQYNDLPRIIANAAGHKQDVFAFEFSDEELYEGIYPARVEGVNAWIAVTRGCDNFCSYCIVPYARGRERSRSIKSILDEARRLAKDGFKQVTLLGQNVNSYQYDGVDFADLLAEVSRIDGIRRIRFMSPHPKDFSEKLMALVAANPKICKHMHFPMQSGNTRILKKMNRTYTKTGYLQKVKMIRGYCPDIALTTDVIVGFPTETDAEFEDTYDVMRRVEFDAAFIFKYSPRKGTLAERKYPDDVPPEIKTERIVRLNALQKEMSLKKNQAMIGRIEEVVIEVDTTKKSDQDAQGRTESNKIVILPPGDYHQGDFVSVKIKSATPHVVRGIISNN
ncbi:MAG: tRNA (N6-isopentenyl adenosine(37)-C2)-methylthiotransferase MiaB [Candidatus Omnitrophica bacterium]|nr:tRNA (N6-isopentenyl adenosine(37)-C2)-methylthiotransferase MiaB [Candidatus Omnitrophota bacterium]